MGKLDCFESLFRVFDYDVFKGANGVEYVLTKDKVLTGGVIDITVDDKTQFEAVHNHEHIGIIVKKRTFYRVVHIMDCAARMLFKQLNKDFPNRIFYVFSTIELGETPTIRFHQKWSGEYPYYRALYCKKDRKAIICYNNDQM